MGGWVLPREIEPRAQEVREWIKKFPSDVKPFLVTHILDAKNILDLAGYIGSAGIQVSEYIDIEEMKKVRAGWNGPIIKTISTSDEDYLDKMQDYGPWCDMFLTDSRVAGYVGGTGEPNDWARCAEVVKEADKPVWLAGGLNLQNLEEALDIVKPWGADVSTGVSKYSVEFPHKQWKDHEKIKAFTARARQTP